MLAASIRYTWNIVQLERSYLLPQKHTVVRGRRGQFLVRLAGFGLTASIAAGGPAFAQVPNVTNTAGGAGNRTTPTIPSLPSTSGSVIPTDVTRTPLSEDLPTLGESLNISILQKLPAPLYMSASVESSFRYETNPFQFPTKRRLLRRFPTPEQFQRLPESQRAQLFQILGRVNNDDVIFRVLPNTTIGWALGAKTRVFGNHFLLRDQVFNSKQLSTTINSLAVGVQRDFPIGQRATVQADFQVRELFVSKQQPVFDFLPGATFTYAVTPRTVAFASALLQLRGKKFFQAPTKEIDPFYSFGALYQRNGWIFSSSATFVQNFREQFGRNAVIRQNNYSWVLDFEVARRLFKQLPGVQAFVRAEPIFNTHSRATPGLSGVDMRVFFGMRAVAAKRPLSSAIEKIREDIMQEEEPQSTPSPKRPAT